MTIIDGPIRSITAGEHAELIGWLKANPLEPRRSWPRRLTGWLTNGLYSSGRSGD